MPQMANITVKKLDGTTDIVYTSLAPSAGDKTPAQWRVESIGTVAGNRPVFSVSSQYSANRSARIISGKLTYPETMTDSTTGVVSVRNVAQFSFTGIVPLNASDTIVAETMAQVANLLKSALIQSTLTSGFAPN